MNRQGDGKAAGANTLPEVELPALGYDRVRVDLDLVSWRDFAGRGRGCFFSHREKGVINLPL